MEVAGSMLRAKGPFTPVSLRVFCHRVHGHRRPEKLKTPLAPLGEQRGDGGTVVLTCSTPSESQACSQSVPIVYDVVPKTCLQ